MKVNVIGAGLAGCECAYQLAKRKINVTLYEMKPVNFSPAHTSKYFAELVCSNSLRSNQLENAVGLLKEELRLLGSLIMECADLTQVEAGGALAVDREEFSKLVTKKIMENPYIEVKNEVVDKINEDEYTIVASGPLTNGELYENIKEFFGESYLYFFDAASPIVTFDSINMDKAYKKARYDKGSADYINCPFTKEEYENFYNELINAKCADVSKGDKEIVFEGCMPVETMAKRGKDTLLFGPLKPVGLEKEDGTVPYGVVQMRKDNKEGSLYNIVGFQTHLKFGEQKRVFSMIPGLENAEFVRYGVMHRNTFINSPKVLLPTYQTIKNEKIFFAGQITGVEGYVESTASGFCAGLNMAKLILGEDLICFPPITAIGGLSSYITDRNIKNFQPMNVSFGIMEQSDKRFKKKKEKNLYLSQRSLEFLKNFNI